MTTTSSSTLDERGPAASPDAAGPRPPAGRPDGARVAAFAGILVLAGLGAAALGSVAGALTASAATTAVRLVLIAAGTVVAGLGLLVPLAGVPGKAHRRVAWTAGLSAAVAALAGYLLGDVDRTGTLLWIVAALLVPAVLDSRFARWAAVTALPVLVVTAVTLGSGHTGVALAADVVFAVAAAFLVGALLTAVLVDGGPADRARTGPGRPGPGPSVDGPTDDDGDPGRVATASGPDAAAAPGRPTLPVVVTVAVAAGTTASLAALARTVVAGPFSVADLIGTAYGLASMAALVLPAVAALAAAVAGGALRRTPLRRVAPRTGGATTGDGVPPRVLHGGAASVAVVAVAAASVAGLLPGPAPAAVAGQALLRTVSLDGATVPVLVAPMRPGPNLVQLGGSGYPPTGAAPVVAAPQAPTHQGHGGAAGHDMADHGGQATVTSDGDPVPFTSRPGARGGWAVVDIPAGTGSLTLSMGGDTATVPVSVDGAPGDTSVSSALTGRDGPECASAIVGTALATGPGSVPVTSCPAQALDPDQASALRSTIAYMAEKGARTVRVVSDPSPRSAAAVRLVREEGARVGLTFPDRAENDPASALVVVSGWEQASASLADAGVRARTTPTHLGGTFLAPWLLNGDIMRQTASSFLPLSFAPNEPDAQRYALALAGTYPDTPATASGFLAWARAAGVGLDASPHLYGAAAVNVPMSIEPAGSTGHHGGPNPASWFPGGTVVPVTGPLGTSE